MADLPARRPFRKPSRLSPSGVLMDIPVMTMRSGLDKINLHDRIGANRVSLDKLTGTQSGVIVGLDDLCQNSECIPRPNRHQKNGVMDLEGTRLAWTILRDASILSVFEETQKA